MVVRFDLDSPCATAVVRNNDSSVATASAMVHLPLKPVPTGHDRARHSPPSKSLLAVVRAALWNCLSRMSHLLFWPTVSFFYPVGNTSAVCLTENLPPESNADILLLACGDPRHILYTIHANEANPLTSLRRFDITCCDVDAAVLARNALLFTLVTDGDVLSKLDNLWNIFYDMFIDQASLSILLKQCRKLVALAENVETWRAGPYGHFLAMCDAATLAELRRVWTAYLDTATLTSKQAKRFEQRFVDGMKEASRRVGCRYVATAARSAGPLVLHVTQAVSCHFSSYWSSGITGGGAQGKGPSQKRRLSVNPTFAFSIDGDRFSVHYGTDPLSGFHLAEAFASDEFTRLRKCIAPHEVVRVAKGQFSRWCTSTSRRLKDSNPSSPTFVVRMFAGDALTFCQALKYCEVTRSPVTPYHVAAFRLSTITLDEHHYGRNALSPAPLSFDVIDTSNLLDHIGLVNILVVTAPLLRKTHSATLYTEALLRTAGDCAKAIIEHVCGELPTMALLLGVIPSTFVPQFTTRSNVHENLMMDDSTKQYHERLAWKAIGLEGPRAQHNPGNAPQRLCFSPEDFAKSLFRVYLNMFSDEDVRSRIQLLSFSPERMLRGLQRSDVLHYNRRSFVLFVHFVKTRVETDWSQAMALFEDLVRADGPLMMGPHAYQELFCQMHLLGVYTVPWMTVPPFLPFLHEDTRPDDLGPFRDWTLAHIPQVVTLALVVPRDAIARLESGFKTIGTPVLQCDMHDGPRQVWFAVTSATFGSLRVSGTGEHQVGVVVEGGAGDNDCVADTSTTGTQVSSAACRPLWRTGAPLIITFSVPSHLVFDFAQNPGATVGLSLRATPGATVEFMDRLGHDLTVFRTQLADKARVFLFARRPVVGMSMSTGRAADASAGAAMADHWQVHTKKRSCAGVHVQMGDMASRVESFTVRIDVTDPGARAALANPQMVPTASSSSGSTQSLEAQLRIGTYNYVARFPLPVDMARVRLRIARRSSYIEVVAPLAPFDVRPERGLSNRFASLPLDNDDGVPALGSIHRVNLDQCPMFKLAKDVPKPNWYDTHLCHMLSELERARILRAHIEPPAVCSKSSHTSSPGTLVHVKQTLHVLLHAAAGSTSIRPDGRALNEVYALFDTSRGVVYLYIIVARMCLDLGSHTVVADAFVAPSTPAVRVALRNALRAASTCTESGHGRGRPDHSDGPAIRHIATDADETAAWLHLLPRLTERCRTWPHKAECAHRTPKQRPQKSDDRSWERRGLFCACGLGVGTEILPERFESVKPNLTRAAFSPLFPVPYLKEVDEPVGRAARAAGMNMVFREFVALGGLMLCEQKVDAGASRTDAVEVGYRCRACNKDGGRVCSRCKRARYCSKECQRADWKEHKLGCRRSL